MSPPINAQLAESEIERESASPAARTSSWIHLRGSGMQTRQTPETFVSDLAVRLSDASSLDEALQVAWVALTGYLPACRVEFLDAPARENPAEPSTVLPSSPSADGCQSSTQLLSHCEWPIGGAARDSDAVARLLSITLPEARQSCEVAEVIDLGRQVAALLRNAVRVDRLRQTVQARTDEVLQLRRRIIQSEKLASYGQLVASTLHDLSNPLTAIVAYSQYLSQTLGKQGLDSSDLERLSRIREASEIVLRQTRQLVEYACPPKEPLTSVALGGVIQRALALCEHELSRAQLQVRIHMDDDLPNVNGHAEHLTQALVNLFTNAAQAARPEHGLLQVSVGVEEPLLKVRVSDNGTGIAPADLEHVFDAFYTTKTGTGCGLGLSIVQDIVEHHRGQISVTSCPPTETTFTLLLPICRSERDSIS